MLEINDDTDTLRGVSYSRKIKAVVAKPLMKRRISCGGGYISIKLDLLSSGIQTSEQAEKSLPIFDFIKPFMDGGREIIQLEK